MRELKYEGVGGGSFVHPELEEIAAYLDGQLSRAERAGITRHLSVCTECLELFTETAHVLRETSAETAGGDVVPFVRPSRPSWRWLPYAAAAMVLFALAVPTYRLLPEATIEAARQRFRPIVKTLAFWAGREMEVAEVLEPLTATKDLEQVRAELVLARADSERPPVIWKGETYRGGEQPEAEAFRALQVLVGAHLVGFQEALEAGDAMAAGDAGRRAANYMMSQGILLESEEKRFSDAVIDLEVKGAPTSRYSRLVEQTSQAIEDSFAGPSYELGKWAQAGYIASRIGNGAWFERRVNRRLLSYLLRQDDEIDPEARKALENIRQVWGRGKLRPAEIAGLSGQFQAILDRYEDLSDQDTLFYED